MRVGQWLAARPPWNDRTQQQVAQLYTAAIVAPHGLTTRWTYTVPAAKRAMRAAAVSRIIRVTAAAPVGSVISYVNVAPAVGGSSLEVVANIFTNAVGDKDIQNQGEAGYHDAGDVITGVTTDGSTGGTVAYTNSARFVEYDA